ncbi:MAG: hypothetical protein Q8K79_17690 [Solirubrobacteraceae bacterium]|nr:hypothetical protein [Solirubrobacteraceae bacterium]
MTNVRTISLSLALALTAIAPAAATARNGADDPPGDDRGGQRVADDSGGSSSGSGSSGGAKANRRLVTGTCTGRSSAKLKVKPDDGRLETEFEVDQNRNGVRWRVTLRRNGAIAVTTRATTRAPSGSFSVERRLANRAGSDTISARATSPSGEVCTARVTI